MVISAIELPRRNGVSADRRRRALSFLTSAHTDEQVFESFAIVAPGE